MLKIEGLKLAPGESEALLYERAAAALRVKAPLHTLHILRRSIDARDGVTFIYTVSAAPQPVMIRRISWSVSSMPSEPRRAMLAMVFSTPFLMMPSPSTNWWPFMNI